ncbi:putative transposable element [Trichonephila clavipes]|nr:putative transposable element [Trichonephila clavipes]
MITNFFIPELNNRDVQELRFQQDGATCHTACSTIDLLKDTFGDRLISRFGPVNWPPRSCDLTPLDYFLWGYVKSLVYADKPQTLEHLEDNIRRVIADIRPQMLEKVIENWTSRLDYIRASRGSSMLEIIFKMLKQEEERRMREKEIELDQSRNKEQERLREKEHKEKESREREHKEREQREKEKKEREKSHREREDHKKSHNSNYSTSSKRTESPSVRNPPVIQCPPTTMSNHTSVPTTANNPIPLNLVVQPSPEPLKKEAELWTPWQQQVSNFPKENNNIQDFGKQTAFRSQVNF